MQVSGFLLQLEGGEMIPCADVVGVFDFDLATQSEGTRELLKRAKEEMKVVSLASDLPKSLILAREDYGDRVYLSGLSCDTVRKRL